MKRFAYILLLALAPVLFFATVGGLGCKATLETGGAYAQTNTVPDLAFYHIDASFRAAYATTDAAFTWERDNRAFLWSVSPKIKHTLDDIRPTAASVARNYFVAREEYKKHPTPSGLSLLQSILAKVQQLSATAAAVMSENLNAK